MDFAQRLIELMEAKHVTAYQLWRELNISQSVIGRWKTGKSLASGENLQKLADFFGVSVDYILGNEQKKEPITNEDDRLTDKEIEFIKLYRSWSPEQQEAFYLLLKGKE